MATFTDEQILAAFPAASRSAFGREGCGVGAAALAHILAADTDPYQGEIYRPLIARKCAQMARRGLLRPGSYHGVRFYRIAAPEATG